MNEQSRVLLSDHAASAPRRRPQVRRRPSVRHVPASWFPAALLLFVGLLLFGPAARANVDDRPVPSGSSRLGRTHDIGEALLSSECEIRASRTVAPDHATLGTALDVTVNVDVLCPQRDLHRNLVLAVPGGLSDAAAADVRAALKTFTAAVRGSDARVGLSLGHEQSPVTLAPTNDWATISAAIDRYRGSPRGSNVASVLGAARRTVWGPGSQTGRRHIILVDHDSAPGSPAAELKNGLIQTRYLGIWLSHICLTGNCNELARAERFDPRDQAETEEALTQLAERSSVLSPDQLIVRDEMAGQAKYVFASASPPATLMGETVQRSGQSVPGQGFIEWTIDSESDHFSASYRIKPTWMGTVRTHDRLEVELVDTLSQWERSSASGSEVEIVPAPPGPSQCTVRAGAAAGPGPVTLGQSVPVTLTLAADCPGPRQEADVVLVVDRSLSTAGGHLALFKDASRTFLDQVDMAHTRIALVAYNERADVLIPFSRDKAEIIAAMDGLKSEGNTNPREAIHASRQLLASRRDGALPLIVLMYDGNIGLDPTGAAEWARMVGIRIATVCSGGSCPLLASSPEFYVRLEDSEGLALMWERLVEGLAQRGLEWLVVSHEPIAAFPHIGIGGDIDPPTTLPSGSLQWRRDTLMGRNVSLGYRLQAEGTGLWPIARSIDVLWGETDGDIGWGAIGVPDLQVDVPPPEGPCEVAAAERDVDPTVVDVGQEFEVRTHFDLVCPPDDAPFHVVFVIDHSRSMDALGRMENARNAVEAFLDQVTGQWLFGLVGFNDSVTHAVPLTEEKSEILEALATIHPDGQTNISAAIDRALELLAEASPDQGGPEVPRAIILLTDGENNAGFDPVRRSATRAKEAGIHVFAVCVGDCDPQLPTAASDPSFYFDVPDPADLVKLFERLATEMIRTLSQLFVEDFIGPDVALVPEEPSPPPSDVEPDRLEWTFTVLPVGGITLTHRLTGITPGRRPVSLSTRVGYSTRASAGVFYLPVPAVEVIGKETPATPAPTLPPLLTPSPTPTPSSTPVDRDHTIYLPATQNAAAP